MKKIFFICFIALSIVSLLHSPSLFAAEIIFTEEFNNNDNQWPIEDDEYAKTSIVNGTYIFEYKMDEGGYHAYYAVSIDTERDFEIEVTLYQISGHDDYGYGLIWDMVDDSNYYSFEISDNGYYRVGKAVADEWIDVIGWTESEYINTYGGKNTLAIAKLGDTYMFFINENYVNLTDVQPLLGDYLGFDIWLKQKIAIESLEVSYIDELDVILDEDFSDNSLAWFEGNDDEMFAEVKNGYYYFEHKIDDGSYFLWHIVDIIPEYDFEISSTITHVSGANDYGYGIVFGLDDLDNLYAFNISDNGYYRYGKYVEDEWINLIGWTESDALRSYNATNTLTIKKTDDKYNFFINDEWVDSYTFETFFGNNIGYVIYKDQYIKIDDLVVKQEIVGEISILDQARQLLSDIIIDTPGYNETYHLLADKYWDEAENGKDILNNNTLIALYLKSAKAEILSNEPRLNNLADALSNAGYILNKTDDTYEDQMGNYMKSYECFSLTLEIDETLGNENHLAGDYINVGATFHNRGYYDEAINNYAIALEHAKKMDDTELVLKAYNHLGWASTDDEKFYSAIDYYQLGLDYALQVRDKDKEEFFYLAIAESYDIDLEDWETAIEYYNKALHIAREQEEMADVKSCLNFIGDCYYYLYEDDLADAYYEEADVIIIDE